MFEFKDLKAAEEFWKRVRDQKAETMEARQNILVNMTKQGHMKRVIETNRSPEQVVKDWAKHFNVLHVKGTANG